MDNHDLDQHLEKEVKEIRRFYDVEDEEKKEDLHRIVDDEGNPYNLLLVK